MHLTSAAVSAMDLEGSALALWNEFLAHYFDGNPHTVGANSPAIAFPKAVLRYQESRLPQPLSGDIGISVVWVAPSKTETYWDTLNAVEAQALGNPSEKRQQRVVAKCAWLFLIRSANSTDTPENAQRAVQSAAGKLYGLLMNSAETQCLAEKGISKLRPESPRMGFKGDGAPTEDLGFRLRILSCAGVLRYPVLSQT